MPGEGLISRLQRRASPNSWTTVFGVIAMSSLVVLIITGVILSVFYVPSSDTVIYRGSHAPLRGIEVSRAFASTLHISLEVRGGLLIRQAHHWAALIMPAALVLQLLSIFFTGTFRRPRRLGWVLLFVIFVLTLAAGWSGYALPDDQLSGTGLRIVEGIMMGIPFIGTGLTMIVFGGEFPGRIIENLYLVHVLIVPMALVVALVARHRSERRQLSVRPVIVAPHTIGLFSATTGVMIMMAGLLTISPVWWYGPSSTSSASAGSQPDWYTGFLDGALRLTPGWEFTGLDRTWTLAVLAPLGVVSIFLGLVALYPFIEERITGDRVDHLAPQRPRDHPRRTGLGAAGMTFYGVLWGAASADILATLLHLTVEGVIRTFQVALVAGPVIAYGVVRRICLGLQAAEREVAEHGVETGLVYRRPDGGFGEVHGAPSGQVRPAVPAGNERKRPSVRGPRVRLRGSGATG